MGLAKVGVWEDQDGTMRERVHADPDQMSEPVGVAKAGGSVSRQKCLLMQTVGLLYVVNGIDFYR
jgi:hypothetical protein